MKLYGVLRSRASRAVWLLKETGTPFQHIPVIQSYRLADPGAADAPFNTLSPGFLALNPQSQIPVLVDGDLILTESMAITHYLATKHGGSLAPASPSEDAQTLQWAFAAATGIEAPGIDILYTYAAGEQDSDTGTAKIAAAAQALERPMARLNTHLNGAQWLVGGRFTVADIMVAECLRFVQPHAPLMAAHPAVTGWLERCQSRPAFQAMMEQRNAEPL